MTEFALARSRVDQNPRFRDENILLLDLDLPERTTEDYAGPSVDPLVQAALDNALRDDGDLELDASKPVDFISACVFSVLSLSTRARALRCPALLTRRFALGSGLKTAKKAQKAAAAATSGDRPRTAASASGGGAAGGRPASAARAVEPSGVPAFPTSRGLVSRGARYA